MTSFERVSEGLNNDSRKLCPIDRFVLTTSAAYLQRLTIPPILFSDLPYRAGPQRGHGGGPWTCATFCHLMSSQHTVATRRARPSRRVDGDGIKSNELPLLAPSDILSADDTTGET